MLMRAMSGQPNAPGWRVGGRFWVGGTRLDHSGEQHLDVRWLPQDRHRTPRTGESFRRPPACETWQEALQAPAALVLLDEPARGPGQGDDSIQAIADALRQRRAGQTVVLITHHQRFARDIADHVVFVCAGRASPVMPARAFFEDPPAELVPAELVQHFVRTGNCWPAGEDPELPSHFHWIVPGRLAGMGRPGLTRDADEDLAAIASAGITHLVTLTEDALDRQVLSAHGIASRHFAIRDMGVPSINDAATLVGWMSRQIDDGKSIALHCHAGLGRTGTMLGALLTWWGRAPEEALAEIRRARAGYVQTRSQERFIATFANRYGASDLRFPPDEIAALQVAATGRDEGGVASV